MSIEKEVNSFIIQTIEKYENAGIKIKDSYWEEYMREAFRDFYLQLKFICEHLKREFIREHKPDFERGMRVYRIGDILLKFVFQPWYSIKNLIDKPKFVWQEYEGELEINEYVDIVLSLSGSIFEYYYSFVKNNVIFNCTGIAKDLGMKKDVISGISKHNNLKKVYDEISSITSAKYGLQTNSLFPPKFVDVRNAIFHMDYYYEKLPSTGNFKIYLNKEKTKEILFDDLIELIREVVPKINTIEIIPYYFASPKSTLPLKKGIK